MKINSKEKKKKKMFVFFLLNPHEWKREKKFPKPVVWVNISQISLATVFTKRIKGTINYR